jgi:phosphatidylserine decarboxylase
MSAIQYWNRSTQQIETEQVYGDAGVRFLYENAFGKKLADWALSRSLPSKLYGFYQSASVSRSKIGPFIETFKIPMNEFEKKDYSSFNDFFIRKFKPGMRPFTQNPKQMAAFAEARYLAFERVASGATFPVKGEDLSAEALLGRKDLARQFQGGPLLLARLCPLDYHRFHYPDDGRTLDSYRIHGALHSVNPLALKYRSEIFFTNERHVSLLETAHLGRLAYIEVGALMVGKIVQTHLQPDFHRGDEKGYFLFGASTVIVMGQPGAWRPAQDLLQQTAQKRETLVRLGEALTE